MREQMPDLPHWEHQGPHAHRRWFNVTCTLYTLRAQVLVCSCVRRVQVQGVESDTGSRHGVGQDLDAGGLKLTSRRIHLFSF